MELKRRHAIEEKFHDGWARQINIAEIEPRRSFEAPTAAENRAALRFMGSLKGKRVLDLGCGLGDAAVYFGLRGAKVTAVDISQGMVKVCQKLAKRHGVASRVRVFRAVGERLPFKDKEFDLIYGNGVLHHLDVAVSAPEIARVLKPGGRAVFIEPLAYNPVIAVYRRLAAGVRTEAEQPMTYAKFRRMAKYFDGYERREVQLLTLAIFLWFFFVEWQNPSQVRYWKKIINEGERYARAFKILEKFEKGLMAVLPFLRPLAWNVVLAYSKKGGRRG